jgi:hypothetical protein
MKQNQKADAVKCAVCGTCDARALVKVVLSSGLRVTLCGTHHLMQTRVAEGARSVEELRSALADRRARGRRAEGEIDELAERLSAAFTRERRSGDRRVS